MFMNINDLREACALIVEVIDERDMLLQENLKLREQLDEEKAWRNHAYKQSIDSVANVINTLIDRV